MIGEPGQKPRPLSKFRTFRNAKNFTISGVTKDSSGNPLANCVVHLFRTGDDSAVAKTTSDGSGNYSFTLGDNAGNFYVVAYLPGAPDVAGVTVNTLIGA